MNAVENPSSRNIPAIVVGVALLLTAGFGLYYNGLTAIGMWQHASDPPLRSYDERHFVAAYVLMWLVCTFCYLALMVCGVDLVRSKVRWARTVTLILVFEVVYFFTISLLWVMPSIGTSVAAATGVANGGLMAQFVILLPLWAPLLLWRAQKRPPA
jgi:hypothetical protein